MNNKLTAICRALHIKPATSVELAQRLRKKLIPVRNGINSLREEGYVKSRGVVDHPHRRRGCKGYRYLRVYELTQKGRQLLDGTLPSKPVQPYAPAFANRKCDNENCGVIYSYVSSEATNGVYDCGKCQRDR